MDTERYEQLCEFIEELAKVISALEEYDDFEAVEPISDEIH